MPWENYVPKGIQDLYEVHEYHHASAILANDFPAEFKEICEALMEFRMTIADIKKAGGSESDIPKRFRSILEPKGWKEDQLTAEIIVNKISLKTSTHKIDFVKGRVAFDMEWNSKDQTFDRDLYAFSNFFDYDRISAGVIVTRSNDLDSLFKQMGTKIKAKYGASTTQMGKLLPRLEDGRNGGCPILVFGIKRALITDVPKVSAPKVKRK